MAGSFVVVSQTPDVQVLGPTQVLNVERVGFVTQPTGIYVEVPVPRLAWLEESQEANLAAFADAIEGLIAGGLATGGEYFNDLDENGLLVDRIDFIVTYMPPDWRIPAQTTRVPIPLGALGASADPWFARLATSPEELIGAAWRSLRDTANLQTMWALPPRPLNPPIRVGDEVIFWNGSAHKLSKKTLAQLDRGEQVVVVQPQINYWGWQPPR